MSDYEIAKKWMMWGGDLDAFSENFGITEERFEVFSDNMMKFSDRGIWWEKECLKYIKKVENHIKGKL